MAFNDVNEAIKIITVEMRTLERERQIVIYNRDRLIGWAFTH